MERPPLFAPVERSQRARGAGSTPPRPAVAARSALRAAAFVAALAAARPALACPDCEAGREARSQAWAEGFGFNVAIALAPFALLGAASAWANRIGRPGARAGRAGPPAPGRRARPA